MTDSYDFPEPYMNIERGPLPPQKPTKQSKGTSMTDTTIMDPTSFDQEVESRVRSRMTKIALGAVLGILLIGAAWTLFNLGNKWYDLRTHNVEKEMEAQILNSQEGQVSGCQDTYQKVVEFTGQLPGSDFFPTCYGESNIADNPISGSGR